MRQAHAVSAITVVAIATTMSCGGETTNPATASLPTTAIVDHDARTTINPATTIAEPIAGVAPTTSASRTALPFVDAFDNDAHGWGGPFQRFEGGDYVWDLPPGQSDSRSPNTLIDVEDEIQAIGLTTTFASEGIASIGVECAFEEVQGSSRWYRLELGNDGANISKQPLGTDPVSTLASNPDVVLNGGEERLRVLCQPVPDGYRLELRVDGDVIATALDVDMPFGRAGAPNLFARAEPATASDQHTVRFHDIAIVTPKQPHSSR